MNKKFFITLLIGILGGGLGYAVHLPLPWLMGAMLAVILACSLGFQAKMPEQVQIPARGILGWTIGAQFNPDILQQFSGLGLSLLLVPLNCLFIIVVGYFYFRKICKLSVASSFFGAIPGGLLDMVVLGAQFGADKRQLTLFHATRLGGTVLMASMLVLFLPYLGRPEMQRPDWFANSWNIFIIAPLVAVAYLVGRKTKLPAYQLLAPMFFSAFLHGMGWVDLHTSYFFALCAQILVGAKLGAEFINTNMREFKTTILQAFIFTALSFFPTFVAIELMVWFYDMNPLTALLAFAPGGQSEMSILAISTGVSVTIVAVHQLFRISIVLLSLPFLPKIMQWLGHKC